MSSKTQPELESRIEQLESGIEQYERLYKKHLMLESELTEAKAKEKVVGVFKTDLDKIRDEIGRDVHQYQ
jgi:DNA-binding transcriptional regulator GbsR (MarR family)